MRILLDECVNPRLRLAFPGDTVKTVAEMGWQSFTRLTDEGRRRDQGSRADEGARPTLARLHNRQAEVWGKSGELASDRRPSKRPSDQAYEAPPRQPSIRSKPTP